MDTAELESTFRGLHTEEERRGSNASQVLVFDLAQFRGAVGESGGSGNFIAPYDRKRSPSDSPRGAATDRRGWNLVNFVNGFWKREVFGKEEKRNCQGKDPSTFEGGGHKAERLRIQKMEEREVEVEEEKEKTKEGEAQKQEMVEKVTRY